MERQRPRLGSDVGGSGEFSPPPERVRSGRSRSASPSSADPVEASAWTAIESTEPGAPRVGARIDYFDGAACSGALLDSTFSPPVAGDTGGFGSYLGLARSSSPAAALSVLVSVQVEGEAATVFTVRLDDLFYGNTPSLFSDGFESSDTSAWSSTVP